MLIYVQDIHYWKIVCICNLDNLGTCVCIYPEYMYMGPEVLSTWMCIVRNVSQT